MIGIMENNNKKELIDFLIKYDEYFVSILDQFNNEYDSIPASILFKIFYKENKIDSLIGYTKSGNYYLKINEYFYNEAMDFINQNSYKIFSFYSDLDTVNFFKKNLKIKPKSKSEYYVMNLDKKNYKRLLLNKNGYSCIKCDISHFEDLKKIQKLYHIEEVYSKKSFYPYDAEMQAFKTILQNRITFAVFKHDNDKKINVSKANVNGATPDKFQLGGVYTLRKYRKLGLSKLCLTNLIDYIFLNYQNKQITLYVKKNNLPAINLYLNLGFKISFESAMLYY